MEIVFFLKNKRTIGEDEPSLTNILFGLKPPRIALGTGFVNFHIGMSKNHQTISGT